MRDKLQALREVTKIQCADGNWNYDPYMQGMANGLILAISIIADESPDYLEAPAVWVKDEEGTEKPVLSKNESGNTDGSQNT